MKFTFRLSVLLFLLMPFFADELDAQVTIGSDIPPEKASLLTLKTKQNLSNENDLQSSDRGGFLLPRVELDELTEFTVFPHIKKTDSDYATQKRKHTGLMVYNLKDDQLNNIEKGIYVWNGEKWEKSSLQHRLNFFYMPSIKIPAPNSGYEGQIDLHAEYLKQFETPMKKNPSAPAFIPFFTSRDDLYYYITYLDTDNVFDDSNTSVGDDGFFRYKIKQPPTGGESYINIVFVIK